MCKIFVQIAATKGHRKRYGKQPRVLLSGATVDVATKRLAERWTPRAGSLGLLTDQLYTFAKKNGFTPTKHLPAGAGKSRNVRGSGSD